MAPFTDQCATCGIDTRAVSPADAAVAIRSYARRYRALLVRPAHEGGPDVVSQPAPDGGWSPLEHAAHVGEVMAAAADAIQLVEVHDRPDVTVEPGPPVAGPVEEVLGRLERNSRRLAEVIDGVSGAAWERRGRLPDGTEVTALALARHAVHVGAHHRREVERALD